MSISSSLASDTNDDSSDIACASTPAPRPVSATSDRRGSRIVAHVHWGVECTLAVIGTGGP
eukprot:7785533-Pyramimonas_sp.AAC.1